MRFFVGGLGFALVVTALVVWLVPVSESVTKVSETSTTKVMEPGTTDAKTTEVVKDSETTEPGSARSDAVLGVLLGTGAVLLLVAAFWSRISEIGLPGGGSIKLTDAQVPQMSVDDVVEMLPGPEAADDERAYAAMMTSASHVIVAKTAEIAAKKSGHVVVDLGNADRWLLPNLFFLTLMLERWTCVTVLVFTETDDDRQDTFVAATSPKGLREALEVERPNLGRARVATEGVPLDQSGLRFFENLGQMADPAAPPEPATWVDGDLLVKLARRVLTLEPVEIVTTLELTEDEMRAILAFPHRYVPVTSEGRLRAIVDKTKVSARIAQFALRKR